MVEKKTIKAALMLRGFSIGQVATKSGTTRRNVERHLSGAYNSSAVERVINELVGDILDEMRDLKDKNKSETGQGGNNDK